MGIKTLSTRMLTSLAKSDFQTTSKFKFLKIKKKMPAKNKEM